MKKKKVLYIKSRQSEKKSAMELEMERLEKAGYEIVIMDPHNMNLGGQEFTLVSYDEDLDISKQTIDFINERALKK